MSEGFPTCTFYMLGFLVHGYILGIIYLIWMFPKIGVKPPKMDGENNGKPY